MCKQIKIEWDHTQGITEYFSTLQNLHMKLEQWGITIKIIEMDNAAVDQIQTVASLNESFSDGGNNATEQIRLGST